MTLHCCSKFILLLILVAKGLYFQKLLDDMSSPLSNLRNSRWRPRWPPLHINDHNSLPVHHRKVIFVSIPRFYGSSYPLELSNLLISYYIMVIAKMAAKMAAITLNLAYLLNYLLQISREGVYHWIFWRHIYLSISDQSSYTDDVI